MTLRAHPGQPLTAVEVEALALTADGLTSDQIARRLHISRSAILDRTQAARVKLRARSTTHAVVLAHQSGQLDFDCGAAGITRALQAAARLAAAHPAPRSAA